MNHNTYQTIVPSVSGTASGTHVEQPGLARLRFEVTEILLAFFLEAIKGLLLTAKTPTVRACFQYVGNRTSEEAQLELTACQSIPVKVDL